MTTDKFALDFLAEPSNQYFGNEKNIQFREFQQLELMDVTLYHIEEITYEEKSPRKEALENVISSLNIEGVNMIYLILGDQTGVHFYFGVARDLYKNKNLDLEIRDIGELVLKPSLKGNFRGSLVSEVKPKEKKAILKKIQMMNNNSLLEGVPGINKDDEHFQGVDRLVDVMLGDEFGLMIIAKPLNREEIFEIEENLYHLYAAIAPLSKRSVQDSKSKGTGRTESSTNGSSITDGESTSKGTQEGSGTSYTEQRGTSRGDNTSIQNSSSSSSKSETKGASNGSTESKSDGRSTSKSESLTIGISKSSGTNTSVTNGTSSNEGISNSTTVEFVNKQAQDWLKYLDEAIIPRMDYGKGKGIFVSTTYLFTQNKGSLIKLGNTVKSLYSGETGNKVPLKVYEVKDHLRLESLQNFQLPCGKSTTSFSQNEQFARAAYSQFVNSKSEICIGNWLSTRELSLIAGLPQKEIVGLPLREEVEFGLNFSNKTEETISLGKLVQSGNVLEEIEVSFDKDNLNKHLFITGVTGSGKTTTCQKLLIDSEWPFLVIEPAKTEYRILSEQYPDILIFTLGRETAAPFRLNPFEFFPHESITSRVDMIKASIESAFDMEAAIPQIIESAIYKCYEDCGWNIATNRNARYENPFADGVFAFPTLSDLIKKTNQVVTEQGFDERLKNDYIGSIRARLQGLLIGSKGFMLNTKRSIDFEQLLDHRVVLELEEIRSASEKSLIMGFILTNLTEAIKAKYLKQGMIEHITLIEEAHRLLGKFTPGDSLNKKQGVEVFSDILAEIRKYGESLMIVDQIPGKLTPEVLKNTNTKIVHRIFAQDDKDAIGNTMALTDEQKQFLSNLETGRAVVFTQGWSKAIQVKIEMTTNTTSGVIVTDEDLRRTILEFYRKTYKRGIFPGLESFPEIKDIESMELYLHLLNEDVFLQSYEKFVKLCHFDEVLYVELKRLVNTYDLTVIAKYMTNRFYQETAACSLNERTKRIMAFFNQVLAGFDTSHVRSYFAKLTLNK